MFNINQISSISFGSGIRNQLGSALAKYNLSKVLVITDEFLKNSGLIDDIIKSIELAGINVCIFEGAKPENPSTIVGNCAEFAKNERVEAFIGVGGGSVLDLAKSSRILMSNPAPINLYFDINRPRVSSHLPLILIPTTSGTSSEVSHGAMVFDPINNSKHGLSGEDLAPTLSYIDPELTAGMPSQITAYTGIDCFCHSAESLTSGFNENPLTDLLATEALRIINNNLLIAITDGSNHNAREMMSLACIWSGIAFDNAPPHLAHAIGHAIGAKNHVPHGEAVGAILPSVISWAANYKPEKVRMIADSMSLQLNDSALPNELGIKVGNAIRKLYLDCGCRPIHQLINENDIPIISKIAMDDLACYCVPYPISFDLIKDLIKKEVTLQADY